MKGASKPEETSAAAQTSAVPTGVSEGHAARPWWARKLRWANKYRAGYTGVGRALLRYERRGVDLATGQWVGNPAAGAKRLRIIAAAPANAFRCQVIPLASSMTRAQQMALLKAKGWVLEAQAVDLLAAPEQMALAVFTLPEAQREAWCHQIARHGHRLVALEPDVHALWRYAFKQCLTHQAWLTVHQQRATLYWPTPWPWGYHAEPVILDNAATAAGCANALMTALRRAQLMTGRESPHRYSILFAGQPSSWALWQSVGEHGIRWQRVHELSPVAAGAALKPRERWA